MSTVTSTSPGAEPVAVPDLRGGRSPGDAAFRSIARAAGVLVLVILALIAFATTREAWPAFREEGFSFLTGTTWSVPGEEFGILPLVFGTLLTSTIALFFSVPVSLGIALFVTQVAPARLRKPVIYTVDFLAVIPSVVFGLWGILVLAPRIKGFYESVSDALSPIPVLGRLFDGPASGSSFFTAGLILAIMITPIITSLAREVIDTTPPGEKEAAYALGATRWEMIRGSVFPHAKGGIVGAVMLGLGRAMGETIAAALVIGSSPQITERLFASGYSMPSIIANEFGEAAGVHRASLIGLGVTLFVITIAINMVASAIVSRSMRRSRGL